MSIHFRRRSNFRCCIAALKSTGFKITAFLTVVILSHSSLYAYTSLNGATFLSYLNTSYSTLLLIDVRDVGETTQVIGTHLYRPYNLPWRDSTFNRNCLRIDTGATILIYCTSGVRSGLAAQHLDSLGYKHVFNLAGGFINWTGPKAARSTIIPFSKFPAPSLDIQIARQPRQCSKHSSASAHTQINRMGTGIHVVSLNRQFKINGAQTFSK